METMDRPAWPRLLTTLAVWVAFFGLLAGLHYGREIVGPLLVSVNLLIAAWPVRTSLVARGAHPVVATVALGLVVFLVLGAAMFSLGWSVSALVKELPQYQDQFTSLYGQLISLAAPFGITQDSVLAQLKEISPASIAGFVSTALSSVSGALTTIGVLAIMLFLLLMDAGSYPRRSADLARFKPGISLALQDFVLGVRRYWLVTTVFGLIVAVLDVALLLGLGVPLALVWGVLSFLTNYIPNVGFVIGLIPPALMALLSHGPTAALIVVIAYSAINFVIQSIVQPKFNGDAVGVTALVSFLSLVVWSMVLGPIGALLGLPATLLLKALLIDHDPAARWFNAFLASDPATGNPDAASLPEQRERIFLPEREQAPAVRALPAGPSPTRTAQPQD